jgi:hypothetical protein
LPGPQTPSCDDQPPTRDEEQSERHTVTRLAYRIVTSWPNTARLLAVIVVAFGLVIFGLWLLQVDVQVGPLRIMRR